MAGIWKDISITWKEKEYVITPTLTFINHLEQRPESSLTNLIVLAGTQRLGTVKCAEIIYDTLKFVDAEVDSVDEVWQSFGGIGAGLTETASSILVSCMPQPKEVEQTEEAKKPRRKTAKK